MQPTTKQSSFISYPRIRYPRIRHPRAKSPLARRISLLLAATLFSSYAIADGPKPAFDFEHLLNSKFHATSGMLMLDRYIVGFAPENATTELLLFNDKNEIVAQNKFWDDAQERHGIWSVVKPQPPQQIKLDKPGIYQMLFRVNGEPATRFPFRLVQTSAGDDPFNPQKTYAFDGLWKRYASVRLKDYTFKRNGTAPKFTVWTGQFDLAQGEKKGRFSAELSLDGKVVAESNKGKDGFIANEHYRAESFTLVVPHEKKDATNAPPYLLEDYADGDYRLRIVRQPDGHVLRDFELSVVDGKISPLAQSELNHEPHIDYLMPRVDDDSTRNVFQMEEAIWLMDKT